ENPLPTAPPTTLVGLSVIETTLGSGCTVAESDLEIALYVAVTVNVVGVAGADLMNSGKRPCPCPSGTVTVAGTGASVGLLLTRLTTAPPAGAGAVRSTRAWLSGARTLPRKISDRSARG